MDLLHHFRKLFEYDEWANREVIEAIRVSGAPPSPQVLKRLGHIVGAEAMWLARWRQQASPKVWPELSLAQCEQELSDIAKGWHDQLRMITPEQLDGKITYVNSKGEPWANLVSDVLTQLVMHSAYHRGQIASDMRAAGLEPAYTDYVHAVRQSLIA
ncbi:MAG TPA: DinB family protein [bacterium]|jgi:uncharacterized damage-inducible protein DinB